jgi:very-short-patch-repair endonuclease
MKENWKTFASAHIGKGNPDIATYAILNSKGHSKLHDNVHTALVAHGKFDSEQKIGRYTVDEVCKKRKHVIEIYGDKFHANPKIYSANSFPHPFRKTLSADAIWTYDLARTKYLQVRGYRVTILWEHDLKTLGIAEAIKCVQF